MGCRHPFHICFINSRKADETLLLRKQVALLHPALWNHLMRSFHPGENWRAHAAQQPPHSRAVGEWRAFKVSEPHPPSSQHNQIRGEVASAAALVSYEDRATRLSVGSRWVRWAALQSRRESNEPSFPLLSALWQIKTRLHCWVCQVINSGYF